MSKNVLFYSEYCFFSKDVMALLTKKNLASVFTLICVDSHRNQLPVFVQSVPTIFTSDRRVLTGQTALDFVDMMHLNRRTPHNGQAQAQQARSQAQQVHPSMQARQVQDDEDAPMECISASSWSEKFSFLEPGDNTNETGTFSGVLDDTRIQCVPENSDRKGGSGGNKAVSDRPTPLSNYMAGRDSDTELLRTQQLAGQGPGGNVMNGMRR